MYLKSSFEFFPRLQKNLVESVRKLDILMLDLIQKITHKSVVTYICMYAILSLLRLE